MRRRFLFPQSCKAPQHEVYPYNTLVWKGPLYIHGFLCTVPLSKHNVEAAFEALHLNNTNMVTKFLTDDTLMDA